MSVENSEDLFDGAIGIGELFSEWDSKSGD
jgi:hypothetical protein